MVDWTYCRVCGTVIDEFESACSGCEESYDWNKKGLDMGNKRGKIEIWLDEHNHKMEFLRTVFSAIAATTGIFVFLKVFGLI
jgi:predicted nucleic acid-binding Zn ribbon protein